MFEKLVHSLAIFPSQLHIYVTDTIIAHTYRIVRFHISSLYANDIPTGQLGFESSLLTHIPSRSRSRTLSIPRHLSRRKKKREKRKKINTYTDRYKRKSRQTRFRIWVSSVAPREKKRREEKKEDGTTSSSPARKIRVSHAFDSTTCVHVHAN